MSRFPIAARGPVPQLRLLLQPSCSSYFFTVASASFLVRNPGKWKIRGSTESVLTSIPSSPSLCTCPTETGSGPVGKKLMAPVAACVTVRETRSAMKRDLP
eukprot:TRINITY_DN31199_c0_g1_i1.p1 TRINITY_DN31199_c0_g1~~TRINITY_DN31199_c0_g1_i1.p1  ORF type:complete len:101 (+),score=5.52 TRINITY_DN31199_c0_g1_i1:165-467(+)